MVNSRTKGADFERKTCQILNLEFGQVFNFRRDLEQYREGLHGDICCDDPDWPFVIELKRYANGPQGGQPAWWQQAKDAANAAEKLPILIYKYDRRDPVVVLQLSTIADAIGSHSESTDLYQTSLPAWITLAREVMAHQELEERQKW